MQHSKGAVTAAEAADMTRQIAELEGLLALQLEDGQARVQAVSQSVVRAGVTIHAAIGSFARKIMSGGLADVLVIRDSARLQHEFDQLTTQGVQPGLHALHHEMQPLMQWVEDMQGHRAARSRIIRRFPRSAARGSLPGSEQFERRSPFQPCRAG